jgi:hypothetical protein
MTAPQVERWIWPLVFGGLLLLVLGLFVQRADPGLGWIMIVAGVLAAAAGAVLVVVRSRMPP